MASFGKDKTAQSDCEIFEIERAPVPDSSALKEQIIRVTKNLPQYADESGHADVCHQEERFLSAGKIFRRRFTLLPAATAIAAGVAAVVLSVTLWAPMAPTGDDQLTAAVTSPVMDELVFYEVILMSEEMAFATL